MEECSFLFLKTIAVIGDNRLHFGQCGTERTCLQRTFCEGQSCLSGEWAIRKLLQQPFVESV